MVRNQTIRFLKRNVTRDDRGQEHDTWEQTRETVLAKVSYATGRLYYEAARANEEDSISFRSSQRSAYFSVICQKTLIVSITVCYIMAHSTRSSSSPM